MLALCFQSLIRPLLLNEYKMLNIANIAVWFLPLIFLETHAVMENDRSVSRHQCSIFSPCS